MSTPTSVEQRVAIHGLTAYAHVADLERSIAFESPIRTAMSFWSASSATLTASDGKTTRPTAVLNREA